MKNLLLAFGSILVGFAIYVVFFSPSTDLLSPLSKVTPAENQNPDAREYMVLGFAPYWNLKKLSPESLNNITHFAYFNLHLNGDGSLFTRVSKREEDPGYTNYKRLLGGTINYQNKPLILTFMPESQAALSSSISTSKNRTKTIETIIQTIQASHASGVNIDYEPLGDISPSLRDNFTLFIKELNERLNGFTDSQLLTISVYASSAVNPRIWDLAALANYTDYFVIMAYDYTMPNSRSAGPNSPLRGSGNRYEHDIIKNIAEISKLVSSAKILLGIPFYGYEWDTIDTTKYSPTKSRGSLASLDRVQKMLDERTLELLWDRNSLTAYGIATNSGQTTQIYSENPTSLKLKIDFVKASHLGGIAIWALGYEGQNSWVWPIIQTL